MKRRRDTILYFFDDTRVGQSQRALLAVILRLDRKHHPFRVLLPGYDGELPALLRAAGVEFDAIVPPEAKPQTGPGVFARAESVLLRVFHVLSYARKLLRYFRMYSFALVHTDGPRAARTSVIFKIFCNSPLIWQLWTVFPGGLGLFFYRWMASVFCDHLVSSSMFVSHQIGRSLHWRERLSVSYRGYDGVVAGTLVKGEAPCVAMAGELMPWKGHKIFLRAIELARRELPGLRGRIFTHEGGPETFALYRGELEGLVRDLKLEDAVELVALSEPWRDDAITGALRACAATALVSASVGPEPFDSGIVEAMGAGVPVVATRSGVSTELILHEMTGLLVRAGDANQLAESIVTLLRDGELAARLAANARTEFEARFGMEKYLSLFTKLYAEILPESEPAEPAAVDGGGEKKKAA